jgi:hypothetical protein
MELKMKRIKLRLEKIRRAANGENMKMFDTDRAKEKMRRFVFDELVKLEPDAISFSRPDSGSGIFEDEDSDDMNQDDDDDEDFDDQDDE